MPKERLHMLLADESFRLFGPRHGQSAADENCRFSFLLGSIFPDVLFYDLPSFGLSGLGAQLHRHEGESILVLAEAVLDNDEQSRDRDFRAWLLGVASHFLADGAFHPTIVELSSRPSPPCAKLGLSTRDCHHWYESELEGYWINLLGPPDGYMRLLRRFREEARPGSRYIGYFRRFMARAGVDAVPREGSIAWCLFWQTLLLSEFAGGRWERWRPLLLKHQSSRYLGSLIVPARPDPSVFEVPPAGKVEGTSNLFHHTFLARTVTYLASRLSSLPVWPS